MTTKTTKIITTKVTTTTKTTTTTNIMMTMTTTTKMRTTTTIMTTAKKIKTTTMTATTKIMTTKMTDNEDYGDDCVNIVNANPGKAGNRSLFVMGPQIADPWSCQCPHSLVFGTRVLYIYGRKSNTAFGPCLRIMSGEGLSHAIHESHPTAGDAVSDPPQSVPFGHTLTQRTQLCDK